MASTNKTPNLELPQWEISDKPEMADFNDANEKIDTVVSTHLAENANKAHGGFKGALAIITSVQSIATATLYKVPWNTTIYNDLDIFNSITPTKLTVPLGVSRVKLHYSLRFGASSTGERYANILKNGNGQISYASQRKSASGRSEVASSSPVLAVNAGDYFELQLFQTSGNSLDLDALDTSFSMEVVE